MKRAIARVLFSAKLTLFFTLSKLGELRFVSVTEKDIVTVQNNTAYCTTRDLATKLYKNSKYSYHFSFMVNVVTAIVLEEFIHWSSARRGHISRSFSYHLKQRSRSGRYRLKRLFLVGYKVRIYIQSAILKIKYLCINIIGGN